MHLTIKFNDNTHISDIELKPGYNVVGVRISNRDDLSKYDAEISQNGNDITAKFKHRVLPNSYILGFITTRNSDGIIDIIEIQGSVSD